ncbi:MAG: NAD(P)/FAD-dependent oxidoreductase [Haloarculaceae archaeon]
MDVIVIGGGISGMASAYYLSERDGVDVTLCEQGENIGHGSTPRAAGGMRSLYSTAVHVNLSLAALEVWNSFEETFGISIDFNNHGYLFGVTDRTQYEYLRKDVYMQNQLGAQTEFIDPEAATEYVPGLNTDRYIAMAWDPLASQADPHACLQAFSQLARENGTQILTDHEVTGLLQDGSDRVRGVEVNDGETELDADYVVNAAGPWGHRVAAMAGVEVPIHPKKRRTTILEPETPLPDTAPLTIDLDSGAYFRPWDADTAIAGGHFEANDPDVDPDDPDSFEDDLPLEFVERAMTELEKMADYFGMETKVVRGWSGVYAITPSNHPIIEESVPGFVNDVGHSGRAFMHSPATGQIVADLVVDGETDLVDTTALRTDGLQDRRGQLPIPYRQDTYE